MLEIIAAKLLTPQPESLCARVDGRTYLEGALTVQQHSIDEQTLSCAILAYDGDDTDGRSQFLEKASGLGCQHEARGSADDEGHCSRLLLHIQNINVP